MNRSIAAAGAQSGAGGAAASTSRRPLDKLLTGLLVGWVALIGADRINLAAGAVNFLVTPFLAVTPFILVIEALRLAGTRGRLQLPGNSVRYCLIATAFLCVVGFSAAMSLDPVMSGRRTVLLAVQVYGTFLTGIVLLNQQRPADILVRGAYLGLLIATVFSVLQVYLWATDGWAAGIAETELFINLAPRTYGMFIPRLSGATIDQGRAGLIYLVQCYILMRFAAPTRWRTLMLFVGSASLVGTLARSAILGAIVTLAAHAVLKGIRLTRAKLFTLSFFISAAVLVVLLIPSMLEVLGSVLEPLAGRFSGEEESAGIHFALIEHGLLLATSTLRNALFGVGYGNGWLVLAEFFPGDRYANFHSLYVTLLAESGVVALVLALVLLGYPFVVRAGPFLPLIAGAIAFNVFYQSTAEPAFWLIVALGWLTTGRGERFTAAPLHLAGRAYTKEDYASLNTMPATGT